MFASSPFTTIGDAVYASALTAEQRTAIEQVRILAQRQFAGRAATYDRETSFPQQDFDDLHRAGLHAPALPVTAGGLGLGPQRGQALALWMFAKELAVANLALARCWEGHVNAQVLLDAMADPAQQERWYPGIVQRGDKWTVWSGEPQSSLPGRNPAIGTNVRELSDGWVVDGSKVFCSNAGQAQWALLLVSTAGAGGARHSQGPSDELLLLACDLSDPSVEYDASWWDPIGMRATASHRVVFRETLIPRENLIGRPGQFLRQSWQACFTPQYAASFLGAAEAAAESALAYVHSSGRSEDPHIQLRMAEIAMHLESSELWLMHAARLWNSFAGKEYDEREIAAARNAGTRTRWLVEQAADAVMKHAVHICGARGLIRPSPLERILRDLTFYMRHDNHDQVLATIGRGVVGQSQDLSFHRRPT